jgi:hypothetical protein
MQDQDTHIGEGLALDRGAHVTVPAMIVDWLRDAAYAEFGSPGEALIAAGFSHEREAHREWFRAAVENLTQTFSLLDAIGWAKSVPPVAVRLDVREDYRWALMRALLGAVDFADDDVTETLCADVEQTEQDLALAQDLEAKRVGALWKCIAGTRASIDEWAVEDWNAEGLVLDFAA